MPGGHVRRAEAEDVGEQGLLERIIDSRGCEGDPQLCRPLALSARHGRLEEGALEHAFIVGARGRADRVHGERVVVVCRRDRLPQSVRVAAHVEHFPRNLQTVGRAQHNLDRVIVGQQIGGLAGERFGVVGIRLKAANADQQVRAIVLQADLSLGLQRGLPTGQPQVAEHRRLVPLALRQMAVYLDGRGAEGNPGLGRIGRRGDGTEAQN